MKHLLINNSAEVVFVAKSGIIPKKCSGVLGDYVMKHPLKRNGNLQYL